MPTPTANYGFTKPDIGASNNTWGAELNGSIDQIDAALDTVDDRVDALEARRLPDADGQLLGPLFRRYGSPLVNYRIPHIFAIQTTDPTAVGASQDGALFLVY